MCQELITFLLGPFAGTKRHIQADQEAVLDTFDKPKCWVCASYRAEATAAIESSVYPSLTASASRPW